MESLKNNSNTEVEDQIDIIAFLSKIWARKKIVLKVLLVSGIIGVIIALSSPNQYTASSMFTPNSSGTSSGGSGLKGLASLAGINIGAMSEGSKELSPMLYGKIMESVAFKRALLNTPLKNIQDVNTLKDYFTKNQSSSSFLGILREYTIGLPSKVIKLFKSDVKAPVSKSIVGITSVPEEDFIFFETLDNVLELVINDKDGFIEMIGKSENPQIAAQLVKNAEVLLQNQIIAIKTKSSLELLRYLETQYNNKKTLLNKAQDRLSNFKDRNLNISRSSFSLNQTRLESELQTASAVFDNVVTQLEQVKFQVTKDTPVFSILQQVVIPNKKSGPKRSLIVLVWLFLGTVLSIGFVLVQEPVQNIIKEIQAKNQSDSLT